MIVADRKSLNEIQEMIRDYKKILLVGCKGCVTVCNVGGMKEVQILASILKIARNKEGRELHIEERTIERQCDFEYVEQLGADSEKFDAILSMACGVGPQFLAEAFPSQKVYPVLDTKFFGGAAQHGIWEERCAGCGTCVIHFYDSLCPIARCAKSLQHGPCGGSANGKCEISEEVDCIWDIIVRKKMEQGRLEDLRTHRGFKDWRSARDGGPRKSIREELVQ